MTDIRLGRAELKLNQGYSSLLNPCRASCTLDYRLVQYQPIDHLTVLNRASNFFDYTNIAEINVISRLGINYLQHRVHRHRSQKVGVLRHDLGREGGGGRLQKACTVRQVDG